MRFNARRGLAAAGAGVLYAVSQPGPGLWPLAFAFPGLLWLASANAPLASRLFSGWLAGTVAALGCGGVPVWWAARTLLEYSPAGSAALVFVSSQLYGALPFAVVTGMALGRGATVGAVVLATSAIALMEYARTWAGMPWAPLAHAVWEIPAWTRGAAVWGVSGVGAWMFASGLAAFLAITTRQTRFAVVCVLAAGVGLAPYVLLDTPEWTTSLRVATLSLSAGRPDLANDPPTEVDLAVWPENALAFALPENKHLIPKIGKDGPLRLLGAPWSSPDGRLRNAAVLVSPGGAIVGRRDKSKLAPIGELVPVWLEPLISRRSAYAPGRGGEALHVDGHRVAALICFEILFPEIARNEVRAGAVLIAHLSNEQWIGPGPGPGQHIAAARFRSAETGRPIVRAATGLSADSRLASHPGSWRLDRVLVSTRHENTPFVKWAPLVPVALVLTFVVGVWCTRAAQKRQKPGVSTTSTV